MFFKGREPVIEEKDRIRYAKELEYIDSMNSTVHRISENTNQIDSSCKILHRKCMDLHKRIDERSADYTQFDSAISRLDGIMNRVPKINQDIEQALESMGALESSLMEHPKYAYLFPKKVDLDTILK